MIGSGQAERFSGACETSTGVAALAESELAALPLTKQCTVSSLA